MAPIAAGSSASWYKPPSQKNGILFSNLSERMRKRRTFADKELECITMEWDLQQRELEEMALAQSLQRPNGDLVAVTQT